MACFNSREFDVTASSDNPLPPPAAIPARASQRSVIDSFIVMDVMRAADEKEAAGETVIHMEVGQPGTPAPKAARTRLSKALETDNLGYTLATGTAQLRQRISDHYRIQYDLQVPPERIIITTGSSAGFILSFLALFDHGAPVGLPNPGYPCYRQILTALGQKPLLLETGEANRWMPTCDQIEQAADEHDIKGALIASPANPTGTMIEPDRLAEICALCDRRGLWFISDEIYHGLTYTIPAQTALALGDNVVVINSFSKYFSMTGWRVGWMVVPERLVRTIERLQQNLFISAPAASQMAALGAFDGLDELEANRAVYAANRDYLLKELPKAGFDRIVPADGAFYLYCDVSAMTDDSAEFARRLLQETGVAATPGIDFDPSRGRKFLRFSYAGTAEDMAEAARRLQAWKNNP